MATPSPQLSMISTWNQLQASVSNAVIQKDSFIIPPSILDEPLSDNTGLPHISTTVVPSDLPALRFLGGADISFFKDNDSEAVACIVVMDYPALTLLYEKVQVFPLSIPYVSGYLAFREKDVIISMFQELKGSRPDIFPQVIFVDGNGLLHPRRF